jgi:hypothetical protein
MTTDDTPATIAVQLRCMPRALHTQLMAAAKRAHRTLSGEILYRLEQSLAPATPEEPAARREGSTP